MTAADTGNAPPRIRLCPPHAGDIADRVVTLADRCGLHLDPWEADVLRDAMSTGPDGKWLTPHVGVSVPRQNGKGAIIEALELAFVLGAFPDVTLLIHSAHEYKTAQNAFQRLLGYFDSVPALSKARDEKRVKVGTAMAREYITIDNRTVKFLARSKSSGRGFSADFLILDEAQDLAEDEWAAILPTVSAKPNPQIWLLGTPPNEAIMSADVFRRFRTQAIDGTTGDADPTRLTWLEWSRAPGDDPADPDVWARTNPAYGIRISREAIQDEFGAMDIATFDRERLGTWDNLAGDTFAVIPEEAWSALKSDSVVTGRVAFAVDVSVDRKHASIAVAGFIEGGRVMVQVTDSRTGTAWIPARLRELTTRWSNYGVWIDTGGPAASLLPDLRRMGIHRIRTLGTSDIKAACGMFYDMAVGSDDSPARLAHPGQPGLDEAVANARKRPLGDAWAWHRRDSTVDITPLVAVTLAAYGLMTKSPRAESGERPKARVIVL